ncbi:hypothetical protein PIB30_114829, partial [Stylosanthes scabra]|nr:hypothetical protein [Stylosanthes scabra]
NNDLLLKNHESRPAGAAPLPEVNVANHDPRRDKKQENNKRKFYGRRRNNFHKKKSHLKWERNVNHVTICMQGFYD